MAGGRLILPSSDPCINASDLLVVGATLTVYNAGTTTLANIFAEISLTTPISNPQVSNAAGRFYDDSTQICAGTSAAYDAVLTFPTGETFSYSNLYTVGAPTTVTGFAPINSPVFTGTPEAPTPAANDSSSNIATTQFVTQAINNALPTILPVGMVCAFAQGAIPALWVACNGAALSRTSKGLLFALIGTTYGAGNGTTTYNAPQLAGYVIRGVNTSGSGPDPSRALGSTQTDAFQGHRMSAKNPGTSFTSGNQPGGGTANLTIGGGNGDLMATTGDPVTDGTNGTPRTANETRMVNVAMQYAIYCGQ